MHVWLFEGAQKDTLFATISGGCFLWKCVYSFDPRPISRGAIFAKVVIKKVSSKTRFFLKAGGAQGPLGRSRAPLGGRGASRGALGASWGALGDPTLQDGAKIGPNGVPRGRCFKNPKEVKVLRGTLGDCMRHFVEKPR